MARVGSVLSQLLGGIPSGGETIDEERAAKTSRVLGGLKGLLHGERAWERGDVSSRSTTWLEGHSLLLDLLAELDHGGLLTDVTAVLDDAPALLPEPIYEDLLYDELRAGRFFVATAPTKLFDHRSGISAMRQSLAVGDLFNQLDPRRRAGAQKGSGPKDLKRLASALEALEDLLRERLLVRSYPLGPTNAHQLVGPLRSEFLLDEPSTLYLKYGFASVPLTLLGQVAYRPEPVFEVESEEDEPQEQLDELLDSMLEQFPDFLASAKWPRVTVTPIAVYRTVPLPGR